MCWAFTVAVTDIASKDGHCNIFHSTGSSYNATLTLVPGIDGVNDPLP